MNISKAIILFTGILTTLLLTMAGLYLATPLLLNWQIDKLLKEQGCESFYGDFQRPQWSQLQAETIELKNCDAGIKHLVLTDVTLGYRPEELIKNQRLGSIRIGQAELVYQHQPAGNTEQSSFALPLPSQLLASLPLADLVITKAKIKVDAPSAELEIQGSLSLSPKQLETNTIFHITPTSADVWQPTTLKASLTLSQHDEFELELIAQENPFYTINGELSVENDRIHINATDNLQFTPTLAWLNQTLPHSITKAWELDGEATNLWHIQVPISFLDKRNTSEESTPLIDQQTQLTLRHAGHIHESLKNLSGALKVNTQWNGNDLKWQLSEGSGLRVKLKDEVMPDDNLSAEWRLYSNNLEGQFQWQTPWRLLSTKGELHAESSDSKKLDISAALSHIFVNANSHSSLFTAKAHSKETVSNGMKITQLQSKLIGLAATHDNEISLKLKTGSYFQAEHLNFNSLSLKKPKAAIIKPIDLRAAFKQKRWQLSPMDMSVATSNASMFAIKANALNGQLNLKSNNYSGQQQRLSQAISGTINATAHKLSHNEKALGSLALKTPFTLNYPTLKVDAYVAWPVDKDPINLSSRLTYDLEQRSAEGTFSLPETSLTKIAKTQLFAPILEAYNLGVTDGNLSASGKLSFKAKDQKALWSADLTARTDKTNLHWNEWLVNGVKAEVHTQATQRGIGPTTFRLTAPSTTGITTLSDLNVAATYDATTQMVHVDTANVKVLGGKLSTQPFNVDLAERSANFKMEIEHMELAELVKLQTSQDIHATGAISGDIPVSINAGKPSVNFGFITASSEGGRLAYTPPNAMQLSSNPGMKIALQAMDNFIYKHLSAKVYYQPDGTLLLDTALKGHNPHWQNGQPVDFNIRIEQNLLKLLQALQFSDKLSKELDGQIRQRIKK